MASFLANFCFRMSFSVSSSMHTLIFLLWVRLQNAPTVEYYGMNITESSGVGITKFSEHYAERVSTAETGERFATVEARGEREILVEPASLQISGGGNGDVSTLHEDLSLERLSGLGQMDVDGSRDASQGTGFDGFDVKYESGMRT